MRFIITLFLLFPILGFGQTAMSIHEAKLNKMSMEKLDSLYKSGLNSDPSLAVFAEKTEEYVQAYNKLLQELGAHLAKHDFFWEKPTKGFNRIYFDKDGSVDYFLYKFLPNQLTKEQEERFGDLLKLFISDYRFSLTAEEGFAQCSRVTYMPQKK